MTERPSIVQFPSAQLCGCPECWKKEDRPLRCSDHSTNNAFVYEARGFSSALRCSPDGRYLYAINDEKKMLIVDLRRNTYKLLQPSSHWSSSEWIEDFVVVDVNTIVLLANTGSARQALYLFRLTRNTANYELRLLHRFQRPTSVCLALDNGGRVVLGKTRTIAVLRLDVAEAAVKVEQTTQFPFGYFVCLAWSGDGRQLYAMDANYLKEVHVYPLEEREWDVEMVSGNGLDLSTIQPLSCSSSHTFYARECLLDGDEDEDGTSANSPIFRCNPEARKWEEAAADVGGDGHVHSIANPTDGEEDGIVAISVHKHRLKIQRFMFRRPDSLQGLALMAARKLREGVEVEEIYREVVDSDLEEDFKFLESAYDGMQPIPLRQLQ